MELEEIGEGKLGVDSRSALGEITGSLFSVTSVRDKKSLETEVSAHDTKSACAD